MVGAGGERQWMMRDFKQRVGMPAERCLEMLSGLESGLQAGSGASTESAAPMLEKLAGFYQHLGQLAAGYVKDAEQRREQIAITGGWTAEVVQLLDSLSRPASMSR